MKDSIRISTCNQYCEKCIKYLKDIYNKNLLNVINISEYGVSTCLNEDKKYEPLHTYL